MNKEDQLKLNQFISKAWKEGLWHSESSFSQSIKGFIDELREKDNQNLLKEWNCQCKKPKPNSIYEVGEHEGRYTRCRVCDRRLWS